MESVSSPAGDHCALFADVHASRDALAAVLDDIARAGVTEVFFLGDAVGYGPNPEPCLQMLRRTVSGAVLGNHDAMALDAGLPLEDFPEAVAGPLRIARETLSRASRSWMAEWPLVREIGEIAICHAGLQDPSRFLHLRGRREVERHFRVQRTKFSFFGHTHQPAVYQCGVDRCIRRAAGIGRMTLALPGLYAIGVGSVAFSRDGDARACWVEWQGETRTVTFHRVALARSGDPGRQVASFA